MGIDDKEISPSEQRRQWESVAIDKGSRMLADLCELRNLSPTRLADIPVADVAAMLKRDNPGLAISIGQLEKAVSDFVRRSQTGERE